MTYRNDEVLDSIRCTDFSFVGMIVLCLSGRSSMTRSLGLQWGLCDTLNPGGQMGCMVARQLQPKQL
jgi:hypothetical protein